MNRPRRHDTDAGGDPEVLAAKAALRAEVWAALTAAKVARFPGAVNRISNFVGAEAAAELLRGLPEWRRAATVKANPDSAQLPVRQRALVDGKTVYMAVPKLAEEQPFFLLDPDRLADPPRRRALCEPGGPRAPAGADRDQLEAALSLTPAPTVLTFNGGG